MGRPLNKKYFGNRNIGTGGYEINGGLSNSQNYADDKIGGEGIASIDWSNYGSWIATAGSALAPLSGLELPAPTIPGGVQATWTLAYGTAAVTTGAGSVGLVVGDTYEYTPIPGSVITVATSTNNGTNATFTVTTAGSTTTLLTDTQTVSITKLTGTGVSTFAVDLSMKVVSATITEKGSGYTGAETFTVTLANSATGTVPAGTIVLTTDAGGYDGNDAMNVTGTQDNAIIIRANTSGSGSTGKVGDIIKQTNARSYKIKTADGTKVCKLGTDATPADGYAYIVATATGGTYYVTKLTAHRATLATKTGDAALDGMSVQWTFGSPTATIVQIENA